MKNYKGSKKDFYRYMQSEIDDDYLEPLKSEILSTIETAPSPSKSEPRRCNCKSDKNCRHPNIYNFLYPKITTLYSKFSTRYYSYGPVKKSEPINAKVTHKFTDEMMRTCISNLGTDAKNCYYGLQEFKIIQDRCEEFKDMYRTLETINVLYLSVAYAKENEKIEAVYLWQMNKKCPCVQREEKQQSILTDVKSHLTNPRYFPSLLLLAKITPEAGEEILEAKILGDNKLLIQSRIVSELVYKIFNVSSFGQSARVNPLQQNILANTLYTWKLKVNLSPSDGAQENAVQVSAWKKCTLEEELDKDTPTDQNKVHERAYHSATSDISLTFVEYSHHGWTILLDKKSSVFIVWKENTIQIFSFTEMMGTIQTFEVIKETLCVLINTTGQIFTLNIRELPSRIAQATPHILPTFKENPPKIQLLGVWDENNLKAVGLVYFWEGKFYYVDIMGNEPAIVLLDLKDETLPQEFSSWRIIERKEQRVLFYVKNDVLNIYDLEKSRHQTQKLLFEGSQQKTRDWQIYAKSPHTVYAYTVSTPEMLIREINYKGEIDNFFNDQNRIQIQYFLGENPIHNKANQNIVQIETPYRGDSIVLLRMKEPVYQDGLHFMNYDGLLYFIPPNVYKELGETPEKRERCPYHKLVDRMEIIQKRAERYQYDERFAEEAEQMKLDIKELIAKRVNEKKEKEEKYDEYLGRPWNRWKRNKEVVSQPEEIDFKRYLDLYKEIKQVQKSLKGAKIRQTARPKNDVI